MGSVQAASWTQYFDQLDAALDRIEAAASKALIGHGEDDGSVGQDLSADVEWLLNDDSLGIGATLHLGQMAGDDEPRARALFVRQGELIERVRSVQGEIRSHMNVAQASVARAPEASIYLDVNG